VDNYVDNSKLKLYIPHQ